MLRIALFGLAAVMLLGGCRRDFGTEGDRLRRQVMELENENQALSRRVQELEAELASAGDEDPAPEAVRRATPRVAEIEIGRLSHVRDDDGDGRPDRLTVYVRPRDGRSRFVQLVGDLAVHAAVLPADEDAITVARIALDPAQVRDAYRSGPMGTHYTVECDLTLPEGRADREMLVRVEYGDGWTGRTVSAERKIGW